MAQQKQDKRQRRAERVRTKVRQTSRPRLSVFRSSKHVYAQVIDDQKGETLVSANDKQLEEGKEATMNQRAYQVGLLLAKKAKEKKIKDIVFDRGRYKYHGVVKRLAEGAREGGLNF